MRRILCISVIVLIFLTISSAVPADAISTSVRVGVNVNLPPYQFLNESGEVCGLHIDLLNAIASHCGLMINYIPYPNTLEAMQAMEENELDLVLGVSLDKYNRFPAILTDSINTTSLCLVADNLTADRYTNVSSFTRYPVTAVAESDSLDYNYMKSMGFLCLILKDSQVSALNAFHEGYADMLVGVKDSVIYQLRELSAEEDYTIVANYVASVSYSLAVHQEDPYLATLINRSLATLHTTGEYESIRNRWTLVDEKDKMLGRLKTIITFTVAALAIIGVYCAITLHVKKILKQEVMLRTNDLRCAQENVRAVNATLEKKILEMEKYNQLLNSIIEASPSAMLLVDDDGNIMHGNNGAEAMIRYMSDGKLYHGERKIGFREMIQSCSRSFTEADSSGRMSLLCHDEEKHQLRCRAHRVTGGAHSSLLLTIEDITAERIEQDARFEKGKNEALNKMIASIAHEIKNPLTTISAAIEMIYTKREDSAFMEAFHAIVPGEVARINRLVQNLVSYARPSKASSEQLDMRELLMSIKHLAEPLANKSGITLSCEGESGLFVLASRDKLNQVFLNLIMNGIESIEARLVIAQQDYSPCIWISARRLKGYVSITITDNGVGMSEQAIAKCTQPFYSTKPVGTGLGLSVSSQYISEIGGTFKIESKPNEFLVVTIFFPAYPSEYKSLHDSGGV